MVWSKPVLRLLRWLRRVGWATLQARAGQSRHGLVKIVMNWSNSSWTGQNRHELVELVMDWSNSSRTGQRVWGWCGRLCRHLDTLPQHNHSENLIRGGLYLAVAWAAFARRPPARPHRRARVGAHAAARFRARRAPARSEAALRSLVLFVPLRGPLVLSLPRFETRI